MGIEEEEEKKRYSSSFSFLIYCHYNIPVEFTDSHRTNFDITKILPITCFQVYTLELYMKDNVKLKIKLKRNPKSKPR